MVPSRLLFKFCITLLSNHTVVVSGCSQPGLRLPHARLSGLCPRSRSRFIKVGSSIQVTWMSGIQVDNVQSSRLPQLESIHLESKFSPAQRSAYEIFISMRKMHTRMDDLLAAAAHLLTYASSIGEFISCTKDGLRRALAGGGRLAASLTSASIGHSRTSELIPVERHCGICPTWALSQYSTTRKHSTHVAISFMLASLRDNQDKKNSKASSSLHTHHDQFLLLRRRKWARNVRRDYYE